MKIDQIGNEKFKNIVTEMLRHSTLGPRIEWALAHSKDEKALSTQVVTEIKDEMEATESLVKRIQKTTGHETVTTSIEGYMAQVEKEAPKPATPHYPTPAETTAFREFCRKTCHGDCEMCKVAPLYDPRDITTCDICGREIIDGEPIMAIAEGSTTNRVFNSTDEEWACIACDTCADEIHDFIANKTHGHTILKSCETSEGGE